MQIRLKKSVSYQIRIRNTDKDKSLQGFGTNLLANVVKILRSFHIRSSQILTCFRISLSGNRHLGTEMTHSRIPVLYFLKKQKFCTLEGITMNFQTGFRILETDDYEFKKLFIK
jgi:hypothetical protein